MIKSSRWISGFAFALFASGAHAQAARPCPPASFAKGLCDGIEASTTAGPPAGKLLIGPGKPLLRADAASGESFAISHLDADAGSQGPDLSKARAQDAAAPAFGGVPAIRPMGRPAMVVPILSF